MTHAHTCVHAQQSCVLCGATNPRGVICARCARNQTADQGSMYTSLATDYLQSRKQARSLRIHLNRRYGSQ